MEFQDIRSWCLCLGCDKELVTKHELLEEPLGHIVLGELVIHWSKNRGALFVRFLERRVEVV
jgi:hypothetical protein